MAAWSLERLGQGAGCTSRDQSPLERTCFQGRLPFGNCFALKGFLVSGFEHLYVSSSLFEDYDLVLSLFPPPHPHHPLEGVVPSLLILYFSSEVVLLDHLFFYFSFT